MASNGYMDPPGAEQSLGAALELFLAGQPSTTGTAYTAFLSFLPAFVEATISYFTSDLGCWSTQLTSVGEVCHIACLGRQKQPDHLPWEPSLHIRGQAGQVLTHKGADCMADCQQPSRAFHSDGSPVGKEVKCACLQFSFLN